MLDQAPVVIPEIQLEVHEAFRFADSDVTLRSSDGVLFRVHKAHLAAHSLFFKGMFEHGQHTADDEGGISCDDTAATLALLLPLCYPADIGDPPVDLAAMDFMQLLQCYEATCKYSMWLAGQLLRSRLLPYVWKDSLKLLRVAYVFQDKEMLDCAANAALQQDLFQNVEEKREKAGPAWTALLEYRSQYRSEVQNFLRTELASGSGGGGRNISACKTCDYQADKQYYRALRDLAWEQHRWALASSVGCQFPRDALVTYIDVNLDNDLVRSCTGCRTTWTTLRDRVKAFKVKCVFKM